MHTLSSLEDQEPFRAVSVSSSYANMDRAKRAALMEYCNYDIQVTGFMF